MGGGWRREGKGQKSAEIVLCVPTLLATIVGMLMDKECIQK